MALSGLGLFLLEACTGTAFLLLFFPTKTLGRGFFSLHGGLAAIFGALALAARPAGLPFQAVALGTVQLVLYTLLAHADRAQTGRPLLLGGALCAGWGLIRVAQTAPRQGGSVWTVVGAVAGGLLFGAVLIIMNLGHWYLVSRSLPFKLPARGAALFAGLVAFRTTCQAAAVVAHRGSEGLTALLPLEHDTLFFPFRVLSGIAGPLALSYFIWR